MKKYCYDYPKPSVTTDCIIIRKNPTIEILLIKRKHDPYINHWALPGGFVEIDEDLEAGATRELKEETGIEISSLSQFKTFGKLGRDPRGRTISIVYYALINYPISAKAGDDAAEATWFNFGQLPKLAFDHAEIIEDFKNSGHAPAND